ncbi:probable serine hydrolase [Drosophila busckii]|uniref:probable serine hydrolase n=1 Tax=Drosophila busckii TaxID=30019 RepID=UPI00083EC4A2|nr:probable serine hydrolase [Drosophila busckii]
MATISLTDFEDVRIEAPWGDIVGRWYGNRQERPILAIHGWMDNLGSFGTLIPLLPDYLGVLCIELPGHGRSAHLPAGMRYHVHDYVSIIGRVMKAYKWSKVSIMGHSLGGALGYLWAALAPHTVDLVISLDIVHPPLLTPVYPQVHKLFLNKFAIADERSYEAGNVQEPPSYSLSELRQLMAQGSDNSVPAELAHHLLYRSVTKSQLFPDKFYFSRDARVKWYQQFPMSADLAAAMASRIQDTPYLIIKGTESPYVNEDTLPSRTILAKQNPHYEFYEVPGRHHVHLTNAEEVAKHIVPFLRHHRPPKLASWSLNNEEATAEPKKRQKRRFFNWRQRSKL